MRGPYVSRPMIEFSTCQPGRKLSAQQKMKRLEIHSMMNNRFLIDLMIKDYEENRSIQHDYKR